MQTQAAPTTESPQPAISLNSIPWKGLAPWLAVGLAMLPMWVIHSKNLWNQPQYQFFPILYFIFGLLIYREFSAQGTISIWRQRIGYAVWMLGCVIFASSVLLYSPYLGQVGGIMWLASGLTLFASGVSLLRVASLISLLALTVIPTAASAELAQLLQRSTSVASAGLLEYFEIPHIRAGNVIEVKGRELFVDEACSGIHSLFAALCVVVILAVLQRSSFLITMLALASVPMWAVIGNLFRITTIAVAQARWQWDLSHGWQHTVLGYINFLVIAICLFVWVKFLEIVLEPIPRPMLQKAHPPAIELFNRWVQWPKARVDMLAPNLAQPKKAGEAVSGKSTIVPDAATEEPSLVNSTWELPKPSALQWAIPSIVAFLGLLNLVFMLTYGERRSGDNASRNFNFAVKEHLPSGNAFAPVAQAWPVQKYEVVERETGSIFGNFSHVWRMSPPTEFGCTASLDFPFFGFHDVSVCYNNSGWQISNHIIVPIEPGQPNANSNPNTPGGLIEFDMRKPLDGSHGFVVFGLVDDRGELTDPPQTRDLLGNVKDHLERGPVGLLLGKTPAMRGEGALLQFQLMCEKSTPFSDSEKADVRQQYQELLSTVRSRTPQAFAAVGGK